MANNIGNDQENTGEDVRRNDQLISDFWCLQQTKGSYYEYNNYKVCAKCLRIDINNRQSVEITMNKHSCIYGSPEDEIICEYCKTELFTAKPVNECTTCHNSLLQSTSNRRGQLYQIIHHEEIIPASAHIFW